MVERNDNDINSCARTYTHMKRVLLFTCHYEKLIISTVWLMSAQMSAVSMIFNDMSWPIGPMLPVAVTIIIGTDSIEERQRTTTNVNVC